MGRELAEIGDVIVEGRLGRNRLHVAVAADGAGILATRQPGEARAGFAVAADEVGGIGLLQLADGRIAVLAQGLGEDLAHAVDQAHGLPGEKAQRLGAADDGEAAGLVEVGRDLGEELVVAEAHRDGNAHLLLDLAGEAGEHFGRAGAVEGRGAGEIEKGFVDRERFNQRRHAVHQGADLAADADIFGHVGRHDHRVGAELAGGEHRHGGAHAGLAGDVAAGGDDAALAAPDDQRLVAQGRVVALFDRGVERVAIDVRDGQGAQLGMVDEPRRAAIGAARRAGGDAFAPSAFTAKGVERAHFIPPG